MTFFEREKAWMTGTSKAVPKTPKRRADARIDVKTGFEMVAPRRNSQHCRENFRGSRPGGTEFMKEKVHG